MGGGGVRVLAQAVLTRVGDEDHTIVWFRYENKATKHDSSPAPVDDDVCLRAHAFYKSLLKI